VLKDSSGAWLAGFSVKLGVCTSVKTELMTFVHGMKIVEDKGFKNIIMDMESKLIVNKRKIPTSRNQAYCFALKAWQALLSDSTLNCQLLHYYRESNRATDAVPT